MGFFKRKIAANSASTSTNNNRKRKIGTDNSNKNRLIDKKRGKFGQKIDRIYKKNNEEIPSSSEDDELDGLTDKETAPQTSENQNEEYLDNKTLRYRETQLLLEKIKGSQESLEEETVIPSEIKERIHHKIAVRTRFDKDTQKRLNFRSHRLSPVCICFSNSGQFLVSCGKDGYVVKYDVNRRCRVELLKIVSNKLAKNHNKEQKRQQQLNIGQTNNRDANMHKGQVICCSISPNDKYLATGGEDNLIKIWDFATLDFLSNFDGHRGPITSLRFRQAESLEMYSSSRDRTIMVWNMDEMGKMNTLFGHQGPIEQLDVLQWPRLISCGGMEKSCRLFKILEDSHLVFNGFADCISIDCLAMINEEHFISGSLDGSLYLWSVSRKKPVYTKRFAHGHHTNIINTNEGGTTVASDIRLQQDQNQSANQEKIVKGEPRWITAVAAQPFTDLVASGSSDGFIRLWKVSPNWKSLDPVDTIEMPGFINDIRFSSDGQSIACAVGQEHKMGRWWQIKGSQNRVAIVPLLNVETPSIN